MSRADLVGKTCKRGHYPAVTGFYVRRRFHGGTGHAYIGYACRVCRIEDSMAYWRRKGGRAKGKEAA